MQIENYREQPPGGSVKAIFDLYLPVMKCTFRNLKLVQSKKGTCFVSFPAFSKELPDGKKEFVPYIEFEKERGSDFNRKVLELLKSCDMIHHTPQKPVEVSMPLPERNSSYAPPPEGSRWPQRQVQAGAPVQQNLFPDEEVPF